MRRPSSSSGDGADPLFGKRPLGVVGRRCVQVSDAEQAAWWADLERWVEIIRTSYDHLWPERPRQEDFQGRVRKRPWPPCWRGHIGLVEDLVALKVWQEGLLDGAEWAGGPRGWCEWRSFVDTLAVHVQSIAQRCEFFHQVQKQKDERNGPVGSVSAGQSSQHQPEGVGTG